MRILMVVLCLCLMTGCAWSKKRTAPARVPQPGAPVVSADFRSYGRVKSVNVEGRFAIISFPVISVPRVGDRLIIYRDGLKIGEAKVTGPQREGNTVADILIGGAREGDEARSE